MQQEGVQLDSVTFGGAECMCQHSCTERGEEINQSGWDSDIFVANSLVDMYAKCGSMANAWRVFNKMLSHDVASWNAILGGCARHGHGKETLQHKGCVKVVCSQMISLLFFFCPLVAMQVWWMKACTVMLQCHSLHDLCKIGTLHMHG
jgi:pentatricopeptide repeat protein